MPPPVAPAFVLFAATSVVLAVVDARTRRLPDAIVLPAFAAGLVLLSVAAAAVGEPARVRDVGLGAVAAFGACLLVRLVRPSAFGGGDVKLAALVGAHLGWFGLEAVASGLASGFVVGGIAALGAVAAGARRAPLAFGPFLLLGAWWRIAAGQG